MAEKRVRRPRASKSVVDLNDLDQAGNVPENKTPGRPKNAEKRADNVNIRTQEILMLTPRGRLDKKTYQIFEKYVTKQDGTRALKGKYKKLLKIEKGVKA